MSCPPIDIISTVLQGDDSSEIKLDFTFDAELAKLTEEKNEATSPGKELHEPPKPIPMPSQATAMTLPTSPATEDLNMKITSVKKIWENAMPTVYEKHSIPTAVAASSAVTQVETQPVSAEVSATPGFNTFHTSMEAHSLAATSHSVTQPEADVGYEKYEAPGSLPEASVSLSVAMAASECAPLNYNDTVTTSTTALMTSKAAAAPSEHSNICKVRASVCHGIYQGCNWAKNEAQTCKIYPIFSFSVYGSAFFLHTGGCLNSLRPRVV